MPRRTLPAILASLLISVTLSGCAISTPFKGPGFDAKRGTLSNPGAPVTVAITLATLGGDRADRRAFWTQVGQVESSLANQSGLIGYSIRTELLGSNSWTMTVWESEDALRAFVEDVAHQDAIRGGKPALAAARFARFSASSSDIPLPWDKALQILERDGRTYRWAN